MAENEVQVLIGDYKMPQMDGLELLHIVSEKYPDVVKIILTGYSDTDVIVEAVNKAGIYKYLTKPYNQNELKVNINNALSLYQLKKENQILVEELKSNVLELEERVEKRTAELQTQKKLLGEENKRANIRSEELGTAFSIIRAKNNEILDSIEYARTIQQAILPHPQEFASFAGYFVLYMPRDIVSRDFYWAARNREQETWFAR